MEKYVAIVSPFTGGKVKEVTKIETQTFRKESYNVHVRYYECVDTGEKFTTTEQDQLLFNDLYAQYRVKHGIPFPDEIKEIRLRYGLNYAQIAKILGFGVNQYAQYENGQVPSESNGKMILAIQKKETMLSLLEVSKDEFDSQEYETLKQKVNLPINQPATSAQEVCLFNAGSRSVYNGYTKLNIEKLREMIKFFVSRAHSLFPTKLNKEMFYADFYHYQQYGTSISGLSYQAIQYGPVPLHYNTIYDNIEGVNKEVILAYDMETTKLTTDSCDLSVFDENEIATLSAIDELLRPLSTNEIVELSHKEDAWINYQSDKLIIPYYEAFSLKLMQ